MDRHVASDMTPRLVMRAERDMTFRVSQ